MSKKLRETVVAFAMNMQLKNHLMHIVSAFEASRSKWPNLGRKRKLTTAEILDRILYVCKTRCQWSQLPVQNASYKTVYHYFALWSKARLFENVFYADARLVASRRDEEGSLIIDTLYCVQNGFLLRAPLCE